MKASSERSGRPRWGQHFLKNASTIQKILDAVNAPSGATVVEVGPGHAALTRPLLERGLRIIALEIDPRLADGLERDLGPRGLTVVRGDAVHTDVGAVLARLGVAAPVPLVGNLPYESATPMIRAFVRRPDLYSRLVVMVQKEVGDRLAAPPGADAYGYLSVDVAAYASARRLFGVRRGDFVPPPLVESVVVELVPRVPAVDPAGALKVASAGFSARRKTLVNGLTPLWGRERALAAVTAEGLPPTARAETLGLDVFQRLAARLGTPGAGATIP